MTSTSKYYEWDNPEFDLLFACNRAGLDFYWSFKKKSYILKSRFVPSLSVEASSERSAFEQFAQLIRSPRSWRRMANSFLGKSAEYKSCLERAKKLGYLLKEPSEFWLFVIMRTLFQSYEEPRNTDTINRVYAFIDWSLWNSPADKDLASEIWTTNLYCFFEFVPDCTEALKDFPNWFPYDEIAYLLEYPPMKFVKPKYEKVYFPERDGVS